MTKAVNAADKLARKARWRARLYSLDSLSYDLFFGLGLGKPVARELPTATLGARILLLSPHQDDEMLGCGGLLLKLRHSAAIRIIFMSAGKGRAGVRTAQQQQKLSERRMAEAAAVCERLQVERPETLGLDSASLLDLNSTAALLTSRIEAFSPQAVLAPFLTDGHPEHVATCRALARVPAKVLDSRQLLLYQVHTQLPDRFVTDVVPLNASEHAEKEQVLHLYRSQHLDRELTRNKYLLLSKKIPRNLRRPGICSLERFCSLDAERLRQLERNTDFEQLLPRLTSINYSPYAFRHFIRNRMAFKDHGLA